MDIEKNKKRNDFLLFLGILMLAGFCLYLFSYSGKRGTFVTITVEGEDYGNYSLFENQEIVIESKEKAGKPASSNTVVIQDGEVYMKKANCPDGLCVRQGKISRNGERIICLPNQVVVCVHGGEKQDYDVITG